MKKCLFCNKKLVKRDNELEVHFASRVFCNRSCAAKHRWSEKKKDK